EDASLVPRAAERADALGDAETVEDLQRPLRVGDPARRGAPGAARGVLVEQHDGDVPEPEQAREREPGQAPADDHDGMNRRVGVGIRGAGGEAAFVRADVTSVDDVKALVGRADELFGRLDILHNNAGVHETNFTAQAQSHELSEEVWDKVIAINLKGPWMCS